MGEVDPPAEGGGSEEHDEAVDGRRHRHGRVVQQHRAERQGNRQGTVVNADLHADGDRLAAWQLHQTRYAIAHGQADQVEQQRGQAHYRGVVHHRLPVLDEGQHDDQHQEQRGDDLHRLLHGIGETRRQLANDHADGHRAEDDGEHLHHLGELQRQGLVGLHEIGQRQVDDEGHGEDGHHRVHRGQGHVQRHIAVRQVAVEVGRGAAGRGRQQHQADRQGRGEAEALGDEEAHQRQQEQLAAQADQYRFGKLHHPGEIRQGQRQAQPEHDDAQGDGQEQGIQGTCGHSCCSPELSGQRFLTSRPSLVTGFSGQGNGLS